MAQVQVQTQGVNSSGNQFVVPMSSLYVGDLDWNVSDSQLYDLFNQIGQVVSVRVCRDLVTGRSLGYGYVNYSNPQDAVRAMELLNFTPLNGKLIRIAKSLRDPTVRKSGSGNIFIKNLDKTIDQKALQDTFSTFGNIISCKIVTDDSGQSKGYGFVQYDSDEGAQKAIEQLNGMLLNDKQVYVGPFLRKQERELATDKSKFTNVYVKNLAEATSEEDLKKIFGEFGEITSVVVMRDGDGKSKCFGFINFEDADAAARSVETLNGKKFDHKEWYVGKAQKKSEREMELKVKFEQNLKETADKSQGLNLYVKNLDDSLGDDKLKELFTPFGTITSCKVMRDPTGTSKGSGFVAFSIPEEASRALSEMNGKMVFNKPLYVALAQRKDDRRARLQAQFSQMRPIAMAPPVGPRLPMYPPGGPGLGQMFYGQAPPAFIPPQQLIPGMRPPAGAPMPNFFVPVAQHGQRPGGRRGGAVLGQQPQQPMQHQMLPRGRVYRYPQPRGIPDTSIAYDMGAMQMHQGTPQHSVPVGALASLLANASPAEQRMMLGESLYPLVEQLEPESSAKVTGMLLEMDQTEVLHLLESPEALRAKVEEAMEVLRNVSLQQQAGNPADQLAELSLNDDHVS
ncbi:polyadenylate-binding protein 2-like isoform X2 [Apium graveolens]|uniref:polyadenylate-binding protein 2-like isoform X2 n=1 Tax=Apium graveolens TaxID=4045 RepID=UPI003D799306